MIEQTILDTAWATRKNWEYDNLPIIEGLNKLTIKYEEIYEMQIYDVIIVDTKECKILHRQAVVVENEKKGMLEIHLTDEIKQLHKEERVEFLFNWLGGFNRKK